MDVRCPKCDTLYEIDARQLRGGAATLKCSQCEYVFRLQTHASLSQENQRRWMVKNTTSGDILYFTSFNELHQWILQGKITKADEVSRTGKKWKRLADVGEFMPIFQAVESISSISASHAAEKRAADKLAADKRAADNLAGEPETSSEPKPAPSATDPGSEFRSKVKTSKQFGLDAPGPGPGPSELSEPSRPEPAHTPTEPARSQTPAAQKSAPRPGASPPESTSPGAPQPSNATQPSNASQPKVRLQTGAFGVANDGPGPVEDDDWSFGDGSSLGELENTGTHEAVAVESTGSRWPVVVLVMFLVVAGGGAAVYFVRPDLIEEFLPTRADADVVDIAEADKADEPPAPTKQDKPPRERLAAAVSEALASADRENAKHLGAGIDAAGPKIETSIDEAIAAATKAAEEPDADEILAKAKRYLESGRPRRARTKFHAVLELERNNVEAITGLGWSLLAVGSPAAASAQFRKALSYNSSYGDAYIGLGKAEREQGNHQAALDAYQNYLNRFPGGSKASIASYQAEKLKKALGQ